jgi:hypothetical protein
MVSDSGAMTERAAEEMVANSGFEDVVNPTPAEITAWAYSGEPEPMEDWDLMLSDLELAPLLLELISDSACPSRSYLLGSLYVLTGDAVRTSYRDISQQQLTVLTRQAEALDDPWTSTWAKRTKILMNAPETFVYEAWCGWGLSRTPVQTD